VTCATNVVVLGAGGFLGRHVVHALAKAGYHVRAITGPPGCGLICPPGAEECRELDLCDAPLLSSALAAGDTVVHLAGPPGVAASFEDPITYVRSHVEGTAVLLKAAQLTKMKRLIYISSAEVYGVSRALFSREADPLQARSPYAACKIAAERPLRMPLSVK
jgi:NDP-hexose 4,6-dehydratase